MRRSTNETLQVASWGDRLAKRILLGEVDPEFVIGVLEPYASERRQTRLKQVFAQRISNVTMVLDALHDPHNGAALLRTSEALGLARVHVVERGESFLAHAGVARGTHKWVQVSAHPTAAECVETLRQSGHALVATHPQGELVPQDLANVERIALVLGNEHEGIAPEIRAACTHSVRVPQRGFAESLNVSVCGGILLAYATEHRAGDLSPGEQRRLYARGLAVTVPNAAALLERADGPRADDT
ncbi:MAG: RNA methyltransferase [Deltaproteobacteria bacterium]|nr:RNA methyltransferase [Deltaproteobacteria bacterium]